MKSKDYAIAAERFKEALAEQDDPETRELLKKSLEMGSLQKDAAAAKEGNWQMALGLYIRARVYFVTPELEARIAEAKKKLEEAPVKKEPDEPQVDESPPAPVTAPYGPAVRTLTPAA